MEVPSNVRLALSTNSPLAAIKGILVAVKSLTFKLSVSVWPVTCRPCRNTPPDAINDVPSNVNPELSETKPFAPANNILPCVILLIVVVSDDIGPEIFKLVSPSRVFVVSPNVSDVVPIVILSVEIIVELAEKFKGLKLTFSKSVI